MVADAPGPTFRNEMFPAYKEGRKDRSHVDRQELDEQMPWVKRLIEVRALLLSTPPCVSRGVCRH
jgi:5'-3' exonuclease